jgi:hypothetical protein
MTTKLSSEDGMNAAKRSELLSVRVRQRQLGRGLRLMYEQVLREPVPSDMIDALQAAVKRSDVAEAMHSDGAQKNH